ncbi:MAG: POT family MFS transporter [Planctomycetaceae bacterium]
MPRPPYLTAPVPSTKLPAGIPYIIGNEAAERFSFYGMRGILVTFMTQYLLDASGNPDHMPEAMARETFHLFVASAYFFPLAGAVISDLWWGKYRTIITLSLVYCAGHLALALDETRLGLYLGLALIAIGSGGIKPCVSAHVGDQFGQLNARLMGFAFACFYLAINLGASISTMVTPTLLKRAPEWIKESAPPSLLNQLGPIDRLGPHLAFGLPGLLMLLATWVFWLGRYRYVHIPPRGWDVVSRALHGDGGRSLARLVPIYVFVAVFWSLYDQTGAAWVLQAEKMDRRLFAGFGFLPQRLQGYEALAEEIQTINPILILVLVPFFSFVAYPLIGRVFPLNPLRKVSVGLFLTVAAFAITGYAQRLIDSGKTPTVWWQLLAYVVMTSAEVMVSVTCLEFSYTQAPRELKSFVMACYLLSVSAGNALTMAVNWLIGHTRLGSVLVGAAYYWFFTALMLAAAFAFIFVAMTYRGQTHLQDEPTPAG